MWIYTKEALTGGRILDKEQEEYLKKRKMSIMLCTSCAGTFVDHEWVSSRTVIQQEVEIFKYGTGFQNRSPVCRTMEPTVVLSTHELESNLAK